MLTASTQPRRAAAFSATGCRLAPRGGPISAVTANVPASSAALKVLGGGTCCADSDAASALPAMAPEPTRPGCWTRARNRPGPPLTRDGSAIRQHGSRVSAGRPGHVRADLPAPDSELAKSGQRGDDLG